MDPKDEIIATLRREVEIGQTQVRQFVVETDRFRAMVNTLNLHCRALQQEIVMVNLRSMEVTKALILEAAPDIFYGSGKCVWLTKDQLIRASMDYVLEKCNEGDPDYVDLKAEGDLLIRIRKSTEEEQDKTRRAQADTEKAETERASPPKPKLIL